MGEVLGIEVGSLFYAGLALSAFFAGRGFSATVSGFIYERRVTLARRLPGLALFGIAATVYAQGLTKDPVLLTILAGLQGILAGLTWPLVQTSVALHSRGSTLILSVYFALGSIGISLGRALYPTLASQGVSRVFMTASMLYMAAGAVLLAGFQSLTLGSTRQEASMGAWRETLALLLKARRALLVNLASGFSVGLNSQVLYPVLVDYKGVDRYTASYALAAGGLASIPSKLLVGALADATSLNRALLVTSISIAASLASLSIFDGIVAAAAAAAYLAFSSSVVPLARMTAAMEGKKLGAPATMVGVSNTLSNIGSMIAPVLAQPLVALPCGLVAYAVPILAAATTPRRKGRSVEEARPTWAVSGSSTGRGT